MNLEDAIHDFTNNSLRIEIINKLIIEDLQNTKTFDRKKVADLEESLLSHSKLTKAIEDFYNRAQ